MGIIAVLAKLIVGIALAGILFCMVAFIGFVLFLVGAHFVVNSGGEEVLKWLALVVMIAAGIHFWRKGELE